MANLSLPRDAHWTNTQLTNIRRQDRLTKCMQRPSLALLPGPPNVLLDWSPLSSFFHPLIVIMTHPNTDYLSISLRLQGLWRVICGAGALCFAQNMFAGVIVYCLYSQLTFHVGWQVLEPPVFEICCRLVRNDCVTPGQHGHSVTGDMTGS